MISVGSEVIKNFEAITLRSYGGEKRKLIPGQLFQGEWLLEVQTLTSMSLSAQSWIVKRTLYKQNLVMFWVSLNTVPHLFLS